MTSENRLVKQKLMSSSSRIYIFYI